ncbi:MAG: response regulator [Deltaproteobacteria bacterium]|nr:response regulator [Deltaproteobacteria bacterium]
MLTRIFPFLAWFASYSKAKFQADAIAGITVALVLIPQSMAYAQLAGLPPYYGLYAALLPPMLASLFGSSMQLATGPVAVVSLMTSASLAPLATAGSPDFIAYAIVLAVVVGLFQFLLGVLRLGLVVNFLSHPVVNGFTNAAAIIIATSQLASFFGVYVDNAPHHYETIIRVVEAAAVYIHWPSLIMGIIAFGLMWSLRKINPRIPNVLVAVVLAVTAASFMGFKHDKKAAFAELPAETQALVAAFNAQVNSIEEIGKLNTALSLKVDEAAKKHGKHSMAHIELVNNVEVLALRSAQAKEFAAKYREEMRSMLFLLVKRPDGTTAFEFKDKATGEPVESNVYRLKVGNKLLKDKALDSSGKPDGGVTMIGGGAVVGEIPAELPSFRLPHASVSTMMKLLPFAAIIAILGFMEAISIAKAMATKTGQRLDPNQELIGQGIANMVGAVSQSYPVSGSFSRSAVNLSAGAVTGMSSVVTSLIVLITLLFFTRFLYNLPQSVLAAVIMMAVIGLVNVSGFVHAWKAQWYDGAISIITFLATLAFAPHLDKGIFVGVALSLGVFLYKSMRPTVATLAMHPDRSLRDSKCFGLKDCEHIAVIRFDGPLFFANASFLEDQVTARMRSMPRLKHILIVANGINDMDASGEEALSLLVLRVRSAGVKICFSGVKENVLAVMRRTHLYETIGEDSIYPLQAMAIEAIWGDAHKDSDETDCPLTTVCLLASAAGGGLKAEDWKKLSRILLVDDEADFVENLSQRLAMRDYGTHVATSGRSALSRVAMETPEVMILDLRMPEVDGFAVLQEVKTRHPEVEVIVLTGQGSAQDEKRVMEMGAFAYLEKPVDIEKLTSVMEAATAKTKSGKK